MPWGIFALPQFEAISAASNSLLAQGVFETHSVLEHHNPFHMQLRRVIGSMTRTKRHTCQRLNAETHLVSQPVNRTSN